MEENIKIPFHVGIILDGNGRWAEIRGFTRSEGHKNGFENLKKLAVYVLKTKGIKYLSVYAFSTENFKRSKEEVDYLMNLFTKAFKNDVKFYDKENIKVIFSGKREPLKNEVWDAMQSITNKTKNNTGGTFNICLNYGGQSEIIDASKKISIDVLNGKLAIEDIDKTMFSKYLYNDLPPMDLLIRTSGEYRLSNFMLWQASYAEFYFPLVHFPDFDAHQFDLAIDAYNNRDRRFGGINYENKNN